MLFSDARKIADTAVDTMVSKILNSVTNSEVAPDRSEPSPDSYNVIAEKEGDMYIDMKDGLYEEVMEKHDVNPQEMFEMFDAVVVDEAASEGKEIRFTADPTSPVCNSTCTHEEWDYLMKKWGYKRIKRIGDFYYATK